MGGESGHPKKLTREQILALYAAGSGAVLSLVEYLQDHVASLHDSNEQIQQRLRAVEEQLRKDSHNSHKPPSSDGPKKITKLRKPSRRRPGGQKGHEGKTLRVVNDPDAVEVHTVQRCRHCGKSLKRQKAGGYDRRQVFDIPPIKVQVTEHRAEIKDCDRCGKRTTAEFPADITHKVQYGPRLKANAAYIKGYVLLPYERAAELFEDLFGVSLSAGTLVNVDRQIGERLEEVTQGIREEMIRSPVGAIVNSCG